MTVLTRPPIQSRLPQKKVQTKPTRKLLNISEERLKALKNYRAETLDRLHLKQEVEKNNIDVCFLSFSKTDKQDYYNNTTLCNNVQAFSFKFLPKDYSKYKFKTEMLSVGCLEHSWIDNSIINQCKYNKGLNSYTGLGTVNFYTRRDNSESIGFSKCNKYQELTIKMTYCSYILDRRLINLNRVLTFGLDILNSFADLYSENPVLAQLYIRPLTYCLFIDKLMEAEHKLYSLTFPKIKVGASQSILGFGKKG